jgi:hypothetical protein
MRPFQPEAPIAIQSRFSDGDASTTDEHKQAGGARYHNRAQWPRQTLTTLFTRAPHFRQATIPAPPEC